MLTDSRFVAFVLIVLGSLGACTKEDDGLTARLMESNNKVLACNKDLAQAKDQIAALKRQLAQAIAEPSRITLTDPDIIELVASRKANAAALKQSGDVEPTLDPKEASRIVMQGASAMQQCYERALKKNASLQYKSGLGVTLAITVKPSGHVDTVEVNPSVDNDLTQCFRTTVLRWKFPSFTGTAVTIEPKLRLTPKT
jgi:septal ring factor EnvC (AmiA/AmiB activator)